MVEQHDAAAHGAAARVVVRGHEGPHARIGAQDARLGQLRGELLAFAQQDVHLVGRDDHVVDLVVGYLARRGADERDRVARHQDVGVGGLAAAVEHHVVHAVAEDEQGPLRREHVHRDARLGGDAVSPDAAGVDDHLRAERHVAVCAVVVGPDADDAVLLAQEFAYFGVGADFGSVGLGVENVRRGETERIDGTVRHAHGSDERRVDRRLEPPCLGRVDDVGPDAGLAAGLNKNGLIHQPVFGQRDEQSVGLLHAVCRYLAQNHVFPDTLHGRFVVRHGIAGSAVQQSVVASGRSGRDVGALQQQRTDAPQRAVTCNARSGRPAADDDDIIRLLHRLVG